MTFGLSIGNMIYMASEDVTEFNSGAGEDMHP